MSYQGIGATSGYSQPAWWWDQVTACLALLPDFRQCLPVQLLTAGEEVEMNGKRFQIIKQIGEGGYSFVYLVRDTNPEPSAPREFALKKVLAGSSDALDEARREIEVMQKIRHPHLLPLLAYSIKELLDAPEAAATHVIYLLFPLYTGGTVVDEVNRLRTQGTTLDTREALSIFLQVCLGVRAMHSYATPYAHRDIKPHNILLNPRSASAAQQQGARFTAVLMDFGSAKPAHIVVMNRNAALAVQEEAEAQCTAAYRAPELFDVPSQCTIDEKVDIWSLGCTLYFMMYGESPFEKALNERGGSLALAIINAQVPWPSDDPRRPEVRELIEALLNADPKARPDIERLITAVQALLAM